MSWKEKDKFCILPFMLLNMRGNGGVKPCSQVQHIRPIPKDKTIDEVWEGHPPYPEQLNLQKDPLDRIWNSVFMRDFRMKKIRNEYVPCCETCYYEERLGIPSKRAGFIRRFYDAFHYIVEEASKNDGRITTMPKWWEVRLSPLCDLSCRVCIPQSSSRKRREFTENFKLLPDAAKEMTTAANALYEKYGYLGDSDFFKKQFWENIDGIDYIELHGGEPLVDRNLWELLEKLVLDGHSRRMHLHVHSNILTLNMHHIDTWNNFKNGTISISIDGYDEENHYLRYPAVWDKLIGNLKLFRNINDSFTIKITSTVTAYQCCTMHKLLNFLDEFLPANGLERISWNGVPVKSPEFLKVEHVPLALRLKEVERLIAFQKTSWMCNRAKNRVHANVAIDNTVKFLRSTERVEHKYLVELLEQTEAMDKMRDQRVLDIFPHLDCIFGVG